MGLVGTGLRLKKTRLLNGLGLGSWGLARESGLGIEKPAPEPKPMQFLTTMT